MIAIWNDHVVARWDALPQLLRADGVQLRRAYKAGIWDIVFAPIPEEFHPLSESLLSYQVFFLAPFHQNEAKNLLDKLDDAAANARRHSANSAPEIARGELVRVPETIEFDVCKDWTAQYLAGHPNGPVDMVLLYQPTVADTPHGRSAINHAFDVQVAPARALWPQRSRHLSINLVVGTMSEGTKRIVPGAPPDFDISHMYTYQRGDFYTVFEQPHPDAPFNGQMSNLSSGIFRHAVLRFADGQEILCGGKFPKEKTLMLYD
jgi:hypothetical protein